jgi:hypothetical protein
MKKFGIFGAGMICGALLIILLGIGLSRCSSETYNGITLFEEESDCIGGDSFKVFQVLDSGDALANEIGKYSIPTGLVVLFMKKDGASYYDDQVIKLPSEKCVRQIGVYKYPTKSGFEKTVPVVDIFEK